MRPLYWLGSKAYSIVFEIERWQISRSVTDVTNETDLIQYSSLLETGQGNWIGSKRRCATRVKYRLQTCRLAVNQVGKMSENVFKTFPRLQSLGIVLRRFHNITCKPRSFSSQSTVGDRLRYCVSVYFVQDCSFPRRRTQGLFTRREGCPCARVRVCRKQRPRTQKRRPPPPSKSLINIQKRVSRPQTTIPISIPIS